MFNSVELEGEVDHSFFDSGSDNGDGEAGVEKSPKAKKQSPARQKNISAESNENTDDEDSSKDEKIEGSELLSKKPSGAFMSLLADTTESESVSQSPNENEEEDDEQDSYKNLDKYSLSLESSLEYQLALNCRTKSQRKNFSFSNDEVRRIERENRRLLQKLTHLSLDSNQKRAVKRSTSEAMSSPVSRLSHTALNRQREQQRIQRENLALLKRLETVKPTADLKRSNQLADYQRLAGYLRPEKAHPSYHRYQSTGHLVPGHRGINK